MPYLGKTPSQATRQRYYLTASGGETSISGTMTTGGTLTFNDGEFVDVSVNGVSLVAGTDYNTTTANTIGGLSALTASDQVEIVVYDTFSVFGGNVDGDFTINNGTLTASTTSLDGAVTINESSADVDFRVESNGNANMLFVDGGNDKVGIGTNSPDTLLHITGASTTTYDATAVGGQDTAATLQIQNTDNSADVFAAIDFNTNNDRVVNRIVSGHGNTTNNGFLAFVTENGGTPAEAMRIDNDGKLIIGTTSSISDDLIQIQTPASGGGTGIQFKRNDNNTDQGLGRIRWGNTADDDIGIISVKTDGADNSGAMLFQTASAGTTAERMRLEKDGELLIGTSSASGAEKLSLKFDRVPHTGITTENTNGTSSTSHMLFKNPNGGVGSIRTSGSATAFNTTSDHRLKENVADMTGAIDRVKQLAPKRFNFIADADTTLDGFLAHEAQTVVPEAVHGTHNEVDDDGNAVMQGIDQSKLVPLLTGALKEAIAKIETLETKVAALEAGE